jgi:hypothetical protein
MKHLATLGAIVLAAGGIALTQDSSQDKPKQKDSTQDKSKQKMPDFKPERQHELLKQFEGEWDIRCKMMKPGEKGEESKGAETARVGLGGFWLTGDFKGEHDGKPFEGQYTTGWEPEKKRFVGTWVCSLMPYMTRYEGESDPSGKNWMFKAECFDPQAGKATQHRMTFEWTDKDHYVHKFYGPGEGGKETLFGEMYYTRKGKTEAR